MKPSQIAATRRLKYRLDSTISRGTLPIIVWLAAITLAFVLVAALILVATGVTINEEKDPGLVEAFWQSLLRILDPGTFSSDEGWSLRAVSLVVTLLGVSIAAVLIGLIASGIEQRIALLRRGRSEVIESGHTLILGFSPRIFTVVAELCEANENQSHPVIVILANRDKEAIEDDLAGGIRDTKGTKVVCRTGDPASLHDLTLVHAVDARSIIVLGDVDTGVGDAEVVKSVLAALTAAPADVPIVAEMSDPEAGKAMRRASHGRVVVVQAADVIARIIAQACRQSGLALVCQDLLDFAGDEIYFAPAPQLVGHSFGDSLLAYEHSVVIGRRTAAGQVELNPPMDTTFEPGDSVIVIAEDDDKIDFTGFRAVVTPSVSPLHHEPVMEERFLVVGWHPTAFRILEALDEFAAPESRVHLIVDPEVTRARVPAESLRNLRCDLTELPHAALDTLTELATESNFDHVILLGYRDRLAPAEADARTLLTLLLLRDAFSARATKPRIVTELLESRDVELARATGADDFVVSDAISSYFMAQLSENPELEQVLVDLFDAEGSAIGLKPAPLYAPTMTELSFADLVAAARERGETALGYRVHDATGAVLIVMNPPKSSHVTLTYDDAVIVVGPPEKASVIAPTARKQTGVATP